MNISRSTQLSFDEACKLIRVSRPELGPALDKLASIAVFCATPFIPAAEAFDLISKLADLLGVKSEISKVAASIINGISDKSNPPESLYERMCAAYVIICYAAFFSAVERLLPSISSRIGLTRDEKIDLSQKSIAAIKDDLLAKKDVPAPSAMERLLWLPHPADDPRRIEESLPALYSEMTRNLQTFIECLSVWETADEETHAMLRQAMEKLPRAAQMKFKDMFLSLARKNEEFFIWSTYVQQNATKASIKRLSAFTRKHLLLIAESQQRVDLGLKGFEQVINHLARPHSQQHEAHATLKNLEDLYRTYIEMPVLDSSHLITGEPAVVFPKKSSIFVPQAYKALVYNGKLQLESEGTWQETTARNDLGPFLLSYLTSPYSYSHPLVILGHPGSGKSLLTSMIAAKLISPLFTPIRVELRDVDADSEISDQVEAQVRKDTQRHVSWASLTDHFTERPPLIILDGYDELLQASGRVFAAYPRKVQRFQENQIAQQRPPVRIIITSRVTLIDKAHVPVGATVLRLMEFDEGRRQSWISVWNASNSDYFEKKGVRPFRLPGDNKKLTPIAEQPLLLLMLALYDSESNQLKLAKELDQSALYDNLLRRFVEREREKDSAFRDLGKREQAQEVEKDMERLGVAAIGMFNRASLSIRADDLNRDIAFFGAERKIPISPSEVNLSQADLLLGSFFFVHQSKSAHRSLESAQSGDTAFEFLHNTFGEFLVADFVLRKVLTEVSIISKYAEDDELKQKLSETLRDPSAFKKEWHSRFIFAPLFSRPVVLSMMREWLPHCLRARTLSANRFMMGLDLILESELKRLLTGNAVPALMTQAELSPFPRLPMLGHIATYSVNLILIRTVLDEKGYAFDETRFDAGEDNTRAWDQLTFLWRSWFSLETLAGVGSVLEATRRGTNVVLEAKNVFGAQGISTRLQLVEAVARTLGDATVAGLSGLLMYDAFRHDEDHLEHISEFLREGEIDLRPAILARELQLLLLKAKQYRRSGDWVERHGHRIMSRYFQDRDSILDRNLSGDLAFQLAGLLIELAGHAGAGPYLDELLDISWALAQHPDVHPRMISMLLASTTRLHPSLAVYHLERLYVSAQGDHNPKVWFESLLSVNFSEIAGARMVPLLYRMYDRLVPYLYRESSKTDQRRYLPVIVNSLYSLSEDDFNMAFVRDMSSMVMRILRSVLSDERSTNPFEPHIGFKLLRIALAVHDIDAALLIYLRLLQPDIRQVLNTMEVGNLRDLVSFAKATDNRALMDEVMEVIGDIGQPSPQTAT